MVLVDNIKVGVSCSDAIVKIFFMETIILFYNLYSGAIGDGIEGLVDDGRWIRRR